MFNLDQIEQLHVVKPLGGFNVVEISCYIIIKVALVRGIALCIIKRANSILHLESWPGTQGYIAFGKNIICLMLTEYGLNSSLC